MTKNEGYEYPTPFAALENHVEWVQPGMQPEDIRQRALVLGGPVLNSVRDPINMDGQIAEIIERQSKGETQ
jgi:hypothetical protein